MSGSAMGPGVIAEAVAAAGAWLRVEAGQESAVIGGLATTAILLAEAYLGMAVIARPFEDVLGVGAGWQRLRAVPVGAIHGITGLPAEGAPFVLPVGAYAIDIDAEGRGWVRVIAPESAGGAAGRVAVAYSAGLASAWDAVPAPIAQGVAMLVAHLFDHRDDDAAPPAAVAALWRPFRRLRLAVEHRA